MTRADLQFLKDVQTLAEEGKTQPEIAALLGERDQWALRRRVERLGFRTSSERATYLRDLRTGRLFSEMLAASDPSLEAVTA